MGILRMVKKTCILTPNEGYSHKVAKTAMKTNSSIPDNSVIVTIYTSDNCAFCKPAIDTVRKAIHELSTIGCKPQVIVSKIDKKKFRHDDPQILALPTISVGRFQLIGLPQVEEIEHLIHRAFMES
jgi:hypothetical protein